MKTGDKVVLVKDISHKLGTLPKDTEGEICNIIQFPEGETLVLFRPDDSTEFFAMNINSVKKAKQ